MGEVISDQFWLDNPEILYRSDRFLEFFITNDMTVDEKLNAIARLSIYTAIIVALYQNNPKFLLLSIIGLAITYFIKSHLDSSYSNRENFKDSVEYLDPTPDNPFMNPVITNLDDKLPKESYSNTPEAQKVRDNIESNFSKNLFQDFDDLFETHNSRRQFFTVPRDSGDLKDFLYGGMKSGKEDQYKNGTTLYEPLQSLTDH